ncbi:hypothetical protein BVC80_1649g4 [Macleaya cordata]|uniref:Uncharacterized protein n=1 Tax=Macleaya cordata TaxID=56857 RepID=A0A200PSK0_MACCD|nr:hypothetical protein BVC80_1649g4 [Macleaya cordata]
MENLRSEVGPRKLGFKLHERQNSTRKLKIKLSNRPPFVNGSRGIPKKPRSPQEEEEKAGYNGI